MTIPFLDALRERVLVCDGAMGTMLYSRGVFINKSFDAMNLTQGPLVEAVHQEYVLAGADILETNTFGANRVKLATFGLVVLAQVCTVTMDILSPILRRKMGLPTIRLGA